MTTKAELVNAIADKAGLTKTQAKDALEAFISAVTDSLKGDAEVRLVGLNAASETIVDRLAIHDKPGAEERALAH